jgi:TrmH RNA methyltransferase
MSMAARTPERGQARPSAQRTAEVRLYGLNACLSLFARRPQDLRKLWLSEARIGALKPVLAWCVKQRIGYRVVADEDLVRLAGSRHHEGVVFDVLRREEPMLEAWLRDLPASGPVLALWLDGVGNPHNLGAILRAAAHFGVAGVFLPHGGGLGLSGAAARVAEGGAEAVPLVRLPAMRDALPRLAAAGFALAATVVRDGAPLYAASLPPRLVLVMGAEGEGVDPMLAAACAQRLGIPGTGAVESLNVAAATAVFLGEWWRRHRQP